MALPRSFLTVALGLFFSATLLPQVTFDFDSGAAGTDLDNSLTGSTTSGGITLTATGFPDGVFNVTSSGFGLNAAAGSPEDTDEFDTGEGFTFYFDTSVELNSLKVSQFGDSQGLLAFEGGSTITSITGTGITSLNNTFVSSGTVLRFTSTGTTPFSLDNFIVTAVPEPATYAAILGALTLLGVVIVRRRQQVA